MNLESVDVLTQYLHAADQISMCKLASCFQSIGDFYFVHGNNSFCLDTESHSLTQLSKFSLMFRYLNTLKRQYHKAITQLWALKTRAWPSYCFLAYCICSCRFSGFCHFGKGKVKELEKRESKGKQACINIRIIYYDDIRFTIWFRPKPSHTTLQLNSGHW